MRGGVWYSQVLAGISAFSLSQTAVLLSAGVLPGLNRAMSPVRVAGRYPV